MTCTPQLKPKCYPQCISCKSSTNALFPRLSFLGVRYIVLQVKMYIFAYEIARRCGSYSETLSFCSSENPAWVSSINSLPLPIVRRPPILDLHHNLEHEASFFASDIFHSWYLGAGKLFLASNIVLATGHFEGSNIPDRFAALNENFQAFCKTKKKKPHCGRFQKVLATG